MDDAGVAKMSERGCDALFCLLYSTWMAMGLWTFYSFEFCAPFGHMTVQGGTYEAHFEDA